MAYTFTKAQQKKAEEFGKTISSSTFGVKCWNCDADLIEHGATRMLVGINPAGTASDAVIDIEEGYLEAPYDQRGYNSWLDDTRWSGNGPSHQAAMRRLFQEMYEEEWEAALRKTATLNIVPFRSPSADKLPQRAWHWSLDWFNEILLHVRPALIICNGSGLSRSPWAFITDLVTVRLEREVDIGANARIRRGRVQDKKSPLDGAMVLAIPFLARFQRETLFSEIARNKPYP